MQYARSSGNHKRLTKSSILQSLAGAQLELFLAASELICLLLILFIVIGTDANDWEAADWNAAIVSLPAFVVFVVALGCLPRMTFSKTKVSRGIRIARISLLTATLVFWIVIYILGLTAG